MPRFFLDAWGARHFMSDRHGSHIDDTNISLAINSQPGRSQNQLHIHISCLKPEIKNTFMASGDHFHSEWQPLALPAGLLKLKHDYFVRKTTAAELAQTGAFRLLAKGIKGAREKMGQYGLAMIALPDGHFLLLATKRNLLTLNLASIEEIQDHSCKILTKNS